MFRSSPPTVCHPACGTLSPSAFMLQQQRFTDPSSEVGLCGTTRGPESVKNKLKTCDLLFDVWLTWWCVGGRERGGKAKVSGAKKQHFWQQRLVMCRCLLILFLLLLRCLCARFVFCEPAVQICPNYCTFKCRHAQTHHSQDNFQNPLLMAQILSYYEGIRRKNGSI